MDVRRKTPCVYYHFAHLHTIQLVLEFLRIYSNFIVVEMWFMSRKYPWRANQPESEFLRPYPDTQNLDEKLTFHLSVTPHLLSSQITVPLISTVKKYTDVDVTIIQLSGLCQNKYAASLSWMCETLRAELKLPFKFSTLDLTVLGVHYDVPNDSQHVTACVNISTQRSHVTGDIHQAFCR